MEEIYLDNSATTKPFISVLEIMNKVYSEAYGNPSSKHQKGLDAENYLKSAKKIIADNLKCSEKEILFTSGGTESDNTALIGAAMAAKRRGNHIITTRIEHPAILETCRFLEKSGFEVTYLSVDKNGLISTDELKNALNEKTILVSIMHTNNEIGAVEPVAEAAGIVKAYNPQILFHTDAVQAYGKFRIIPKKMNIDMMSVSGHKIHGPKGIGFLYIKEGTKILPYIYGGGQQGGMRSGTENVPAIAGLAEAVSVIYSNLDEDINRLKELRRILCDGLGAIDGIIINGAEKTSAPHIVSASVAGVRAEVMLHALEEKGIYVSSGSACASNKKTVSDTLSAISLNREYLDSTIRLSMSVFTTQSEIEYTINVISEILPELRKYTRR